MISIPRITALAFTIGAISAISASAEAPSMAVDLLRFTNHDTLHGKFLNFGPSNSIIWNTPEATTPINFSTDKLHRIVLNRGKAHQQNTHLSNVKIKNGDIIPGKIISLDQNSLILETKHLGNITIPKNTISKVSPSPFGGKIIYYGPLNSDDWKTVPTATVDDEKDSDTEKEDEEALTDWQHIGAAWYTGTDKSRFLLKENILPDKCRVNFKLAWRGSLYAKVAFHADFSPPQYDKQKNTQLDMGPSVGHAYVLSLSSHSASLTSCTFDEDGKPQNNRLEGSQSSMGLSGTESADMELRLDKTKKNIILYVNGDFKAKWNLGSTYAGQGRHLAFKNQRYSKSEIRVSDIVVSHWNGMKDSANSMQAVERDIVLLNNGLDRFSGKFKEIREEKAYFQGSFGNDMVIPINEISEIHLATGKDPSEVELNEKQVYFYLYPHGRITGVPSQGSNGRTKVLSDLIGELSLDTQFINIIDFSHQNSLLDNWDDNF